MNANEFVIHWPGAIITIIYTKNDTQTTHSVISYSIAPVQIFTVMNQVANTLRGIKYKIIDVKNCTTREQMIRKTIK